MTACFADTFYFLALLNPHDDDHDIAVRATRTLRRPLVTTSLVLVELADGLAGTRSRHLFGPFYRRIIRDSKLTVVPCDDAILERGVRLYDQRLDKGWSLTDCISFVVMTEKGIVDALTGDHHFEQAGFRALLKAAH